MVITSVVFATIVIFAYFVGRWTAFNEGYIRGVKAMKEYMYRDMCKNPTKWKYLIDKESND